MYRNEANIIFFLLKTDYTMSCLMSTENKKYDQSNMLGKSMKPTITRSDNDPTDFQKKKR